jgi:NAD+ diphosphatase
MSMHYAPFSRYRPFTAAVVPPLEHRDPVWWFAFQGDKLLVYLAESSVRIPHLVDFSVLEVTTVSRHYLGHLAGQHCYTVEVAQEATPPSGMAFQGLRQVYGRCDEDLFWVAGRAVQIVDWDRNHQFCGRCGTRMQLKSTERAKECPQCHLVNFPRLSPAVITLVERGQELLLARSRHFAPGMYSVLAGFVEPGETLEAAVEREIWEEVGLYVKDIRYFGSQPWPFPNSLMLGFTAVYADGQIRLDDTEIEDANWFTVDNLPMIPGKISIARKLIDWFLAKHGHSTAGD